MRCDDRSGISTAESWRRPLNGYWLRAFGGPVIMNPRESPPETPDHELLARIAQRDTEAFSRFYDRFCGVLFSVAVNILKDTAQAEDVLQEVFVQIWDHAASYDPHLGKPLSWSIAFTRNRSIDRLRAIQRRTRLLEEVAETAEIQTSSNPEIVGKETAALIRAALKNLPGEQRQAIELAFFSGLTQSEIASELKEPLGTIKARIRRGMLRLREALSMQI